MLSLKIALRYLLAKKSHRAVNIITLIAVIGVAVATMAMVLVLSIFNGFRDLAVNQLSGIDPDIAVVAADNKVISSADSLAAELANVEGVSAALPVVTGRALLDNGIEQQPVYVKGVPAGYDLITGINASVISGVYAEQTTQGVPAALLSVGVANRVHMAPSPETIVRLTVPRRKGRINPANPVAAFRSQDFAFSGVFRINNAEVDNEYIVIPLDAARDLFDYDNDATSIEIAIETSDAENKVKKALEERLGDNYHVQNRIEQRATSFQMISIEKWVTFMMLVCILVITLFNVVSTLSLLAIEKRDNMWTLRSLGASSGMVRRVFIAEGFLVTTLGGAIGIVFGVLIALLQQTFHLVKLSADAASLTIDYYPVHVEATDLLTVGAVIVALALIVSFVARLIVRNK